MRNKRSFRIISVLLICFLVIPMSAGCYLDGYTKEEKKAVEDKGEEYLISYLKGLGTDYRVTELNADTYVDRHESKVMLTGFISGWFETGPDTFRYSVNTETGDVYTDEKMAEFYRIIGEKVLDRYGIEYDDYDTNGSFSMPNPLDTDKVSSEYLQYVLPVNVFGNLEAYVDEVLSGNDTTLKAYILYHGEDLEVGDFALSEVYGAVKGGKIQIVQTDLPNVHPESHNGIKDEDVALSSVLMEGDTILFRTYDVYRGYSPIQLQYSNHCEWVTLGADGEETREVWDIDPEADFQYQIDGSKFTFTPYPENGKDSYREETYASIFMDDLSGNDNQEVYATHDSFHGWSEKHLVNKGDRYVADLNQGWASNNLDREWVFTFGEDAQKRIKEQEGKSN